MDVELEVACSFFASLMESTGAVPAEKIERFGEILHTTFKGCYEASWHPDQPFRGSGNRCIRVHPFKLDPLLAEVGELSGIENLHEILPHDLTLWIDPNCVCYRFGERTPIYYLYDGENAISPVLMGQDLSPAAHFSLSPASSPTPSHHMQHLSGQVGFGSPHMVPQHYAGSSNMLNPDGAQQSSALRALTLIA